MGFPPSPFYCTLELVEHEEGSGDEAAEGHGVVPAELVAGVEDGEDAED
jgi:hypothetical protein